MSELTPFTVSPFDAIRRVDERGGYWTGRDLMPLMDYGTWEKFQAVIEKAKASLAIVQGDDQARHHFAIRESDGGRWGNQKLDDYRLTRLGAYLVAMAGDDTKVAVAQARVYFAVKTREAEVAEVPQLTEVEVAERWLAALKREKVLEAKVAEQEPKVEAYDEFLTADGDYQVATVAQMLGTGQNRLFALLRDEGVLIAGGRRHNTPNQQYMRHFRVVATTYDDGEREHATFRTYVKPSGVDFIRKVLKLQALIPGGAA